MKPSWLHRGLDVWLPLILLVGGAGFLFFAGPAPQTIYPADVAAYLDAVQRSTLGQVLGRDFYSPIGPVAILPSVLAARLGVSGVAVLSTGSALLWLGLGGVGWIVARKRTNAALALLFGLLVAGAASAPYTLDFGSWRVLSYAMSYNRIAWALLGIAAMVCSVPRTTEPRRSQMPTWFLGATAAALWALKPNYLVVLAPLGLAAFWNTLERPVVWWRVLGALLLSALGTLALVAAVVPFDPWGYSAEHIGMAGSAPSNLLLYTFLRTLRENVVPVLLLLIIGAFAPAPEGASPRFNSARKWIVSTGLIASVFVTNVANCQFSEVPLWGMLACVLVAELKPVGTVNRCAVLLALLQALTYTWQPLASIVYAAVWKSQAHRRPSVVEQVDAPAWRGLLMRSIPGDPTDTAAPLREEPSAAAYARWLNDGLGLVRAHHPGPGKILCLDWVNPFPFALAWTPIQGDQIAWHVGRTVGEHHHPSFENLLQQADLVAEPLSSMQPASLAYKQAAFEPLLRANFHIVGHSTHWRLWARARPHRSASSPSPSTP